MAGAKSGLAVAYLPVADLVPYVSNARTHSDDQVAQIAASIKEFGFTNPILIDGDKGIIAGHGRLQAARKLGLDTVPTIELHGLSDAQRRAYILADNKLALNAGWDNELLALELADLADLDFDLNLIGFDEMELEGLNPSAVPADDAGDNASLADRFGIPPFSVLNAREGWWQGRKRAWLALGIKSELGRGENLIENGGGMTTKARYDQGGALTWSIAPSGKPTQRRAAR